MSICYASTRLILLQPQFQIANTVYHLNNPGTLSTYHEWFNEIPTSNLSNEFETFEILFTMIEIGME